MITSTRMRSVEYIVYVHTCTMCPTNGEFRDLSWHLEKLSIQRFGEFKTRRADH